MSQGLVLQRLVEGMDFPAAKEFLTQNGLGVEEGVGELEDLFIVKYQHGSPKWNSSETIFQLMSECRGAIFSKRTYHCVCLPFYKFWSHKEHHASSIQWNKEVRVFEKLDGSLMKLFWYNGTWRLASNGRLETDEPRDKLKGRSIRDLFDEAAKESQLDYSALCPQYCYIFERLHPNHRIVIPYEKPALIHIGTRDMTTLKEIDLTIDCSVPRPKQYDFNSLKDVVAAAEVLPWDEGEGFVVCDKFYNRVKVKSLSYLRMHHQFTGSKGKDPLRFCLQVWLNSEEGEIVAHFPEYEKSFDCLHEWLDGISIKLSDEIKERFDASKGKLSHFFSLDPPLQGEKKRFFNALKRRTSLHSISPSIILDCVKNELNCNRHLFASYFLHLIQESVSEEIIKASFPVGGWN